MTAPALLAHPYRVPLAALEAVLLVASAAPMVVLLGGWLAYAADALLR